MMAPDRPTRSPRLEPETEQSLRALLAQALHDGDHVPELHDALCRTADEAHAKGIQAEQLLILLKDIWFSLPELARARSSEMQNELLQQLISRCIQQYYAE